MTTTLNPNLPAKPKTRKAWLAWRRTVLRRALGLNGLTMTAWCEASGYSRNHIYGVLNGRRESPIVDALVARTIKLVLGVEI